MKPLAAMPAAVVKSIRGVFCDIDDTLTSEGKLSARAYAALERLRAGGKLVIPITGRPAGWCDHIARMWPVDAVVGENGAFYFWYDARAGNWRSAICSTRPARAANRDRMAPCANHPARGAGLRARLRPVLPRVRPGDRLLRGRAALGRRAVDASSR